MASNVEEAIAEIPVDVKTQIDSIPTLARPKNKRSTWAQSEEKHFLIICGENAIAEQLDNCVTSAGVSTTTSSLIFHKTYICLKP